MLVVTQVTQVTALSLCYSSIPYLFFSLS